MTTAGLDTLREFFPEHPPSTLERYLTASNGNVERAIAAILQPNSLVTESRPRKRQRVQKLDSWLTSSAAQRNKDAPSASTAVAPIEAPKTPPVSAQPSPTISAFSLMKARPYIPDAPTPGPPNSLPPLRLTCPEQIQKHARGIITFIPNVLPTDLAARLFLRLVDESLPGENNPGWERNRWFLVDRQVVSPHTTSFYVESPSAVGASAYDQEGLTEAAHHWYNGERREARLFLSEMNEARELIGALVRTILSSRDRHPLEWQGPWEPNVAAANCYRGAKESVGMHSDVLTHLGPYPTIASLSLGCTRPFRLRSFLPESASSPNRTLEILLPHNSLCIMHAGCQETFKHTVPPVPAMDVFKMRVPGSGGEVRKFRERINLTLRHYRPDFAPLPPGVKPEPGGYAGSILCHCGIPTTLRPDAKGRARAKLADSAGTGPNGGAPGDDLLFFWTCAAGMQNEGKTCGFFKLLDFQKEGRGKWFTGQSSSL